MNNKLDSQIFLDSGDPEETRQADQILKGAGFPGIQGQTTNPSLISKNPQVQHFLASGNKLTTETVLAEYRKIVEQIARVTGGPISIQIIADDSTSKEEMLKQAQIYKTWISNGVIKFPCTGAGLSAAEIFCQEWSVNMTLNFSQEQAAAVYQATRNAKHRVFISTFVGRLDDRGENGMQVVKNILQMYTAGDGHVQVLTASVRHLNHLLYALQLKSPVITVPFSVLQKWQATGFKMPDTNYSYPIGQLTQIEYKDLDLTHDWHSYNLQHDLTDAGVRKFMEDWKSISEA